jgi:hypothetical protein
MKSPKAMRWPAALTLAVFCGFAVSACLAADDVPAPSYGPEVILRWDPVDNSMAPIAPEKLKVGCVYNYFSPRLQRRVWSYLQPDRQFWNAFGPGTVQEVSRFDLTAPLEERLKRLREVDKDLAQQVFSQGRTVFVKLDANGRWSLDRTAGIPAIYDLETGMRWERHHIGYIPVVHLCGDSWGYAEGQFFPWD